MKIAVYPGSFNPYHRGHADVLDNALRVFDKIILAIGNNPDKSVSATQDRIGKLTQQCAYGISSGCLEVVSFDGLLSDYVKKQNEFDYKIHAIIRGLRNGQDFEFEKTQQYWNEDLQIGIPTLYFIADRMLTHVSSSAIRVVDKYRGNDGL